MRMRLGRSWLDSRCMLNPFSNTIVVCTFCGYPQVVRRKLLALRALSFKTAAATEGVSPIQETLKWGESAYLTSQSHDRSTIHIGWNQSNPSEYAMYFHCQTNLISPFRNVSRTCLHLKKIEPSCSMLLNRYRLMPCPSASKRRCAYHCRNRVRSIRRSR